MSRAPAALLGLALLAFPASGLASGSVLNLEAQMIAGYSSAARAAIFFSREPMEAMQKPGVGFDWLQRLSSSGGDWGLLAVQARLAFNAEGEPRFEPQLYNAFLKLKLPRFDLWAGHGRPAFGLASFLDSHSLLLQPLAMEGIGFDRDWGIGLARDTRGGNAGLSLTSGSGMPLHFKGNYFLAARVARGVLARDNFSLGVSAGYGRILETMGNHLADERPFPAALAGLDLTWLRDNLEMRLEAAMGSLHDRFAWAFLWRGSALLLAEGRLRLELQPNWLHRLGRTHMRLAAAAAFQADGAWTLRAMLEWNRASRDLRLVMQVHFLKNVLL